MKKGKIPRRDKSGHTLVEYDVWVRMRMRCHQPKDKDFKRYGARGIKVCERWRHSFDNFLADMGRRHSSEHSLHRINNDGDYEPGNCKWATRKEQNENRRIKNQYTRS